MKFQKQNTPFFPAQDTLNKAAVAPACPLLNIAAMDDHGLVMEMLCGFEVGSTIVLGFHLHCDGSQEKLPQGVELSSPGSVGQRSSVFISLEVIVVESKMGHGSAGQPVYLVTGLFSGISNKDRKRLLSYTGSNNRQLAGNAPIKFAAGSTLLACTEKFLSEVTQRIYLN
ncbi:MAG: hypothetical protein QM496_16870 [Verrucomicrobiota bacterium]